MARNLAYYMDPEEERRRREAEIAEAFPEAPLNLGVAPVPRLPISAEDRTTPRMTDRAYPPQNDAWATEEPTEEELAADVAEEEALAPASRERRDPTASNPYDDAPPAVDKKAASVAEEQKGIPAGKLALSTNTEDELGWADELLGQVRKRVFDKPEATESALHQKAEEFASQSLEPRKGFSRDDRASRSGAAYGDDEAPSTRWEDEFAKEHGSNRLTDDQIRRRAAAIGAIGALFNDDMSAGQRWAQTQHAANRDYDAGREKARAKDWANSRISRGMAEAIAATGQMSPEAAAKLTHGDETVRNFGQYASQGGRAEGQALGREKAQMDHAFDLIKSDKVDDRVRGMGMLQSLTTLGSAEIRAQALSQMTPEQIEALKGSWMASHLRVSPEVGAAVVAGDTSKLTPEQKDKADKFRPVVESAANDARVRGRVVGDQVKEAAGAEVKQENAVQKSIELVQRNPEKAQKWQQDWHAAEMPLKKAIKGWEAMSPAGKKAFSQWTQTQQGGIVDFAHIGDQWNKYNLPPEDQIHASRVLEAINSYVKANAGSAVTGSEWDRIAHRTGLATGTWAPFNNPEVVGTFLKDSADAMTQNRLDYERIMNGWK